jgi:hypothetical protein
MKFLCIGYFDPARMAWLSQAEIDTVMAGCDTLLQALYATGCVLFDVGVGEQAGFARRNGGTSVLCGVSTERIGALIGGAFMIEAGDMDDALRIASQHPAVSHPRASELGWRLEVRPVQHFTTPGMPMQAAAFVARPSFSTRRSRVRVFARQRARRQGLQRG